MESINACEMPEIPPREMARLQKLGIKPVYQGRYAFAQRFDENGEPVPTKLSLLEYTVLLEALAAGFKNAGSKIDGGFNGEYGTTLVKYPSLGFEDAPSQSYQLEFVIPKSSRFKKKIKVTVQTSGTEKISKIAREISRVLKLKLGDYARIDSWHNGESFLWERPSSVRLDPSPLLHQVTPLEKLFVAIWASHLPVTISELTQTVSKLEVQLS